MKDQQASAFPASVYREHVLTHVFADAQRLFLPALLEIDRAHLVMLRAQDIVSAATALSVCARAADAGTRQRFMRPCTTAAWKIFSFSWRGNWRHSPVQTMPGGCTPARSRNDIDLTMYRMVLRANLLAVLDASLALRAVLLTVAQSNSDTVMPAYTHNQPAQPTTLAHYLLAMVEVLERDAERMIACYARVNRSPLGACAITTTGFPIDRHRTERLLGFRGLAVNSYGAIAAVDYVAEACSVLATAMLSLGRFTQDMLLWSTEEFGFLRLSDGYVQISSIMPQKRNPVPLEHTRILASRALTEAQSVLGSLHNTPFADMNDGEDSLQPLVSLAFADGHRALSLLAGALSEATFRTDHMRERAKGSFLTVTEVADTLVRNCGVSFHTAHEVVSGAVKAATTDDVTALASDLHVRTAALGLHITEEELRTALNPVHFVRVRTVTGGPAPEAVDPELARAAAQLTADEGWSKVQRDSLHGAQEQLHREFSDLVGDINKTHR